MGPNDTRTIRGRLAAFAAAALVAAAVGSGCIFDTRSAERPPVDEVEQIPLDDAIDVFTSMRSGLEGDAISNYERALSDEFVFSPLLDDSLDQTFAGTDVFSNWTKDVEREVLNLLLSDADTIQVGFTPSTLIEDNTFVRYETEYSLRVVARSDGSSVTYEGVAHIDVRREGGIWRVTFWDEVEPVEGRSTWGFLRGTLRQRLQ